MPTLSSKKEAYYMAVDNTDYPQNMKKYIKKLISNCGSPEEIFQLTLFYLYNCQTAQLPDNYKSYKHKKNYTVVESVVTTVFFIYRALQVIYVFN